MMMLAKIFRFFGLQRKLYSLSNEVMAQDYQKTWNEWRETLPSLLISRPTRAGDRVPASFRVLRTWFDGGISSDPMGLTERRRKNDRR